MADNSLGPMLTLSYAESVDFVFVEVRFSKNLIIISPASIRYAGKFDDTDKRDHYEIKFFDYSIYMDGADYGKRWRCWEMHIPKKIDTALVPWKECDINGTN